MKVQKISYIIINVQMTKDYFQIQKKFLNDLDNGDASLLNDESTNDSEEVVTEQSNNDEASSKTYQTLYSKQDNNDIKGKSK